MSEPDAGAPAHAAVDPPTSIDNVNSQEVAPTSIEASSPAHVQVENGAYDDIQAQGSASDMVMSTPPPPAPEADDTDAPEELVLEDASALINTEFASAGSDPMQVDSQVAGSSASGGDTYAQQDSAMADLSGMSDADRKMIEQIMLGENSPRNGPSSVGAGGSASGMVELDDLDDDTGIDYNIFPSFSLPEESKMDGEIVSTEDVIAIKELVWGREANPVDVDRWYEQGFGWIPLERLRFGLLQLYGGPCGVLAPVQGYILRYLLFDEMGAARVTIEEESTSPVVVVDEQRESALVWALATIIEKCAMEKNSMPLVIAVDEVSKERFWCIQCATRENLEEEIAARMPLWSSKVGVVAFLFSVILARGVNFLKGEVDDLSQPLVLPQFGHCSQELVNLMITGRAVTNVHDGDKILGEALILRGIGPDQEIGFLTSFEVFGHMRVGEHYKTPQWPVWVIGSQSHYSVMFALDSMVGKVSTADKEFADLKRKFNVYDQMEHGFIQWADTKRLLTDLGMPGFDVWSIKNDLDPDRTNIVVWVNFLNTYLQKLKDWDKKMWACTRCTFRNKMEKKYCDVCSNFKSSDAQVGVDPDAAVEVKQEIRAPKNFALYYLNGLRQTKKDKPVLIKLNVMDEAEIDIIPPGMSEQMTGLIRTKWPYAVVEYTGKVKPQID